MFSLVLKSCHFSPPPAFFFERRSLVLFRISASSSIFSLVINKGKGAAQVLLSLLICFSFQQSRISKSFGQEGEGGWILRVGQQMPRHYNYWSGHLGTNFQVLSLLAHTVAGDRTWDTNRTQDACPFTEVCFSLGCEDSMQLGIQQKGYGSGHVTKVHYLWAISPTRQITFHLHRSLTNVCRQF